jgi:2-methylisocitrate lyase-like PEP mutase family enzyme
MAGVAAATDRRLAFRRLHEAGCFVIPNPWDLGSAKLLAQLGFKALASTSAGLAWSLGRADNHVPLAGVLAHLKTIASGVDIPLNADFEGGFAVEPADVAVNVAAAVATGIAGLSIEDSTGDAGSPLFELPLAVERIRAARAAIAAGGDDVVLTARSEGYLVGRPDLAETIRRLTAFAAAGADCLYAPGLGTPEDVSAVVRAVAPRPVNVLASVGGFTVNQLADLGVRRISVGGALARCAWAGFFEAATEIAERGTFTAFTQGMRSGDLNQRFTSRS